MIFTDYKFLYFLLAVFVGHWLLNKPRRQKFFLLACSYVFYASWDWRFLGLILIATAVNYFCAARLHRTQNSRARKGYVALAAITTLSILGFFKYFNFFVESAGEVLNFFGFQANLPTLRILLPVGISFYTFQSLSYTIDVYREKIAPTKDFTAFALFVAFFPQLVAGPIERAEHILPQIAEEKIFGAVDFRLYGLLFLAGFFKKAVLADNLAPGVDAFFSAPETFNYLGHLLGVLGYSVQLYADFSGYTDMAIASAGFLGFRLSQNFKHPYFAPNPSEFWRRWHVTLHRWFRDYVYIPLGGNRRGEFSMYTNILIAMLLGGLWHGAGWNFIFWSFLNALALIGHKVFVTHLRKNEKPPGALAWCLNVTLLMAWIVLARVFFRAPSYDQAMDILVTIFSGHAVGTSVFPLQLILLVLFATAIHWMTFRKIGADTIQRIPSWLFGTLCGIAFSLTLAFSNQSYEPFIYFQF